MKRTALMKNIAKDMFKNESIGQDRIQKEAIESIERHRKGQKRKG